MSNEKIVEVLDKNCIGHQEYYEEFYECPNCHDNDLIHTFKYCPKCGVKLHWNVTEGFSSREEVIINTGKLKGISGNVRNFNRRTGEVIVLIDKNEFAFNLKDVIRKR
ncbi:hypothetical protein FDB50_15565 [Clostridium botulinum]|uniref:Uncharacterized protein n=1 Tax=Clostridium botulinum TaxID=1491 RepID=A0A846JXP4_CLOBO|nr:hypothetical protein [Clostridium botulinum]NFN36458.1 hypothetical protein [Clostridium botulinum]